MRPEIRLIPLFLSMAFTGCVMKDEQACTTELRINFCVTANGKPELPSAYKYVRERVHGGTTHRDTLSKSGFDPGGSCFAEGFGRARVLAVLGDSIKAQSPWVLVKDDGCHSEATTVDLTL